MLQGNNGKITGGFMVYSEQDDSSDITAFGHSGLGGSIGMCDIQTNGDVYAIAITTNRLSFDAIATRKILRCIYKDLGLKTPTAFMK